MRVLITYVLTFFICLEFSYSQENSIKSSNQRIEAFNNAQGFYQNTVSAITSDIKGYLWIGTPNGLVRYDGYTFEYFYHEKDNLESLPNNYISDLLSDSMGRLWIITNEGLCIYITNQELFVPIESLNKKESYIKEGPQKKIWVVNGSSLNVYDSNVNTIDEINKLAEINLDDLLNGNDIIDIEFLSNSELIVATASKMYKVNFNESENYSISTSRLQFDSNIDEVKKVLSVNNSIWIASNNGLYHAFYENNRLIEVGVYFNSESENFDNQFEIISLYVDKEKKLWIGTKQNGVLKYDTKNTDFVSFKYDPKYKNGLTSNRINCFYEDVFGVLWIGTAQGGLNKFDKNQNPFQNYAHNPYDEKSLSSNLITDITEDNEGKIWISFFESSICRTEEELNIKTGNQVHFEQLEKQLSRLKKEWVLRLYQDIKGYWWISTNKNLYLYDDKKDELKIVQLEIEGKLINPVFNKVIDQINNNQLIK